MRGVKNRARLLTMTVDVRVCCCSPRPARGKLSLQKEVTTIRTGQSGGEAVVIIQADTRELNVRKHICALSRVGIAPAQKPGQVNIYHPGKMRPRQ